MRTSILSTLLAGSLIALCSLQPTPAHGQSGSGEYSGRTEKQSKEPPKPTPHLSDGKVDFGGKGAWAPIWVLDWSDQKYVEHAVDVPFTTKGLQLFQQRRANESKDDP